MNKRGMLLASETLKIVVAVVCIGFLVYLLAALYFSNSQAKDIEEAKARLEEIKAVIDSFDKGNLTGELYALTPSDWGIFSYNQGEQKPNVCAGVNCICLCEDNDYSFSRQFTKCNKQNVCLANERFVEFEDIYFEDGGLTNIKIVKDGPRIRIVEI